MYTDTDYISLADNKEIFFYTVQTLMEAIGCLEGQKNIFKKWKHNSMVWKWLAVM